MGGEVTPDGRGEGEIVDLIVGRKLDAVFPDKLADADALTPVLTKRFGTDQPWKIENYERLDGYAGLRKALTMEPDAIIALVNSSCDLA